MEEGGLEPRETEAVGSVDRFLEADRHTDWGITTLPKQMGRVGKETVGKLS